MIIFSINFNFNRDGHVYEGDWVNDLRQGHGIMKFIDGTIYGVSLIIAFYVMQYKFSGFIARDFSMVLIRSLSKDNINDYENVI